MATSTAPQRGQSQVSLATSSTQSGPTPFSDAAACTVGAVALAYGAVRHGRSPSAGRRLTSTASRLAGKLFPTRRDSAGKRGPKIKGKRARDAEDAAEEDAELVAKRKEEREERRAKKAAERAEKSTPFGGGGTKFSEAFSKILKTAEAVQARGPIGKDTPLRTRYAEAPISARTAYRMPAAGRPRAGRAEPGLCLHPHWSVGPTGQNSER